MNSVTYSKIMHWNSRWGLTSTLARLTGRHAEPVIQDVDIPIANALQFLTFLLAETGILPIWICPIHARDTTRVFPLYRLDPRTLYINFGFWDSVQDREPRPPGYHNRRIERKVRELAGIKSLYSDAYFSEAEFVQIYEGEAYGALKRRYDPQGALPTLYQKCVLRQ